MLFLNSGALIRNLCFTELYYAWCNLEPESWKEFSSSPTLLSFVGRLGLDAVMGMELFCLIGIMLSFVTFVSRKCGNFIFFLIMWMLYLSVFRVSLFIFIVITSILIMLL